jgi:hypothetical protein
MQEQPKNGAIHELSGSDLKNLSSAADNASVSKTDQPSKTNSEFSFMVPYRDIDTTAAKLRAKVDKIGYFNTMFSRLD